MWRFLVLGLFLVAIIFFLLPWASISCLGTDLVTTSGLDLVRGTYSTADLSDLDLGDFGDLGDLDFGDLGDLGDADLPTTESGENEPIAVGVLVAAAVGVIVSIFRGSIWRILRVLAGLAGVGLMIWLYFHIKGEIPAEALGILQINILIGVYLTAGALAIAAILSIFIRDGIPKERILPQPAAPPPQYIPPPGGIPPPPPPQV